MNQPVILTCMACGTQRKEVREDDGTAGLLPPQTEWCDKCDADVRHLVARDLRKPLGAQAPMPATQHQGGGAANTNKAGKGACAPSLAL